MSPRYVVAAIGGAAGPIGWGLALWLATAAPAHAQPAFPPAEVERGRYLTVAGDCTACHTAPVRRGSPAPVPFAGGYPIVSPLGAIISSNITPSRAHGIGAYTEADFARALRQGIRRDGAHLYPAMPYTAYAGLSDADIHALYAYFMQSVAPVEQDPPKTALPFPFNVRASMALWNGLFLNSARVIPDPKHDAQWNRGAYLVEALEHCSACHSPRGLLMNESRSARFAGGSLGAWYAPNITSDPVAGIGGWRREELVSYLKTGRAPGKAQAAGGMAEAVTHSLQHLTDADLEAIAAYIATIPPAGDHREAKPAYGFGAAFTSDPALRGESWEAKAEDGAALYSGLCASCHGVTGQGSRDHAYPSLVGNTTVGAARADNLVAVIREGVDRDAAGHHSLMPGFGADSPVQTLSDADVARVATYVRARFGPGGPAVTADDVSTLRRGGPTPLLVRLVQIGLPVGVLAVLVAAAALVRRRRSRPVAPA